MTLALGSMTPLWIICVLLQGHLPALKLSSLISVRIKGGKDGKFLSPVPKILKALSCWFQGFHPEAQLHPALPWILETFA